MWPLDAHPFYLLGSGMGCEYKDECSPDSSPKMFDVCLFGARHNITWLARLPFQPSQHYEINIVFSPFYWMQKLRLSDCGLRSVTVVTKMDDR